MQQEKICICHGSIRCLPCKTLLFFPVCIQNTVAASCCFHYKHRQVFHRYFLFGNPQRDLRFLPCSPCHTYGSQRANLTPGLAGNAHRGPQVHQGFVEIAGPFCILPGFHQLRDLFFHFGGKNIFFNIVDAGKHTEHVSVHRRLPFPIGHAEDGPCSVIADAF